MPPTTGIRTAGGRSSENRAPGRSRSDPGGREGGTAAKAGLAVATIYKVRLARGPRRPLATRGDDVIDPESLEEIERQVADTARPAFRGRSWWPSGRLEPAGGRDVRHAHLRSNWPALRDGGPRRRPRGPGRVLSGCPWLPVAEFAIRADIPMVVRRGPRPSARVEVVMRFHSVTLCVGEAPSTVRRILSPRRCGRLSSTRRRRS